LRFCAILRPGGARTAPHAADRLCTPRLEPSLPCCYFTNRPARNEDEQ
jgi:hypothetical protein